MPTAFPAPLVIAFVTGAAAACGAGGAASSPDAAVWQDGGGAGGRGTGGVPGAGGAAPGAGGKGGSAGAGGAGALVNPAPGSSKLFAGVNFWRIDWEGSADFFQSGVDFATAANPWNPSLVTDLAPFKVIRYMDWNLTNDSNNPQASWSTRKQKTQSQTSEPIAFEWQIDLCNRTRTDYWVTVPHESNLTTYPANLAQLVHDQLDPSLRVYVEWSNEVWNSGFPQNAFAASQGSSLGLDGSNPALSYQVYASVRVWEAFEAVFGKGSPRLVKVLSGQSAWNGPCTNLMAALGNTAINPNGTMPTVFAVAPYFSGTTIAALGTAVAGVASGIDQNVTCAAARNLPVISYEGGSDSYAEDCRALQVDAGMKPLYKTYLDTLAAHLRGPFMQYTAVGECWGLKVETGDSTASSPKYAGVTEWLVEHP